MQSTIELLRQRVTAAVAGAFGLAEAEINPLLNRSQDDKFGDYQSNCAMGLAKKLGKNPREVAQRIVDHLDLANICSAPEIAGPGFINLRLEPKYIATQLASVPPAANAWEDRLGIDKAANPVVAAVDLSSPNLAKEMHVGHVRSTILGDCVARILEFEGHEVHRINHVGDWGTQFGMLLAYLRRTQPHVLESPDDLHLDDLEKFYVAAKTLYDADPEFAETSRQTVVELQSQQPEVMAVWRAFCYESLRHCHEIYDRLDVRLEDRGESFYRDMLPDIVRQFEKKGLAKESDGALCVFLDGFTARDGEPLPMMIRKSDGGYNYDTTDLAAIYHRIETLQAKRLIYLVGIAQKQHFQMLFAAARKIGWGGSDVELVHLGFGNMLAADGTPFKTRDGGTIKLKNLLDEAFTRAKDVIVESAADDERRAQFDEKTVNEIAAAISVGAVKYFDLSHNLSSDYKFDWDTMLSLEGNTAPYMLYAYARVRSIGRKAGIDFATLPTDAPYILEHDAEIRLARTILRFAETVHQVAADLRPNVLTDYLYDLSKAFSLFYDRKHGVRIIDAEPEPIRLSRLRLCDLTARTLRLGLSLLGIKTVEQM